MDRSIHHGLENTPVIKNGEECYLTQRKYIYWDRSSDTIETLTHVIILTLNNVSELETQTFYSLRRVQ